LDGDEPLQLVIVGEIDEAETASTENFFDAVATDVLRLRSGNSIDGGLVVAVPLVIRCDRGSRGEGHAFRPGMTQRANQPVWRLLEPLQDRFTGRTAFHMRGDRILCGGREVAP